MDDQFLTAQPFRKKGCMSSSFRVKEFLTMNHFLSTHYKNLLTVKPLGKTYIVKFLTVNHFAEAAPKKILTVIDSFHTDNADGVT